MEYGGMAYQRAANKVDDLAELATSLNEAKQIIERMDAMKDYDYKILVDTLEGVRTEINDLRARLDEADGDDNREWRRGVRYGR